MKKFIPVLIVSILISYTVVAQSAGDYRSVGSGNWNDATKWERFNGNSWVSAVSYPGEQMGTGLVTILNGTEIRITETVPYPVSSLFNTTDITVEWPWPAGILIFSAESAISLTVTGDITIYGSLYVENRNAVKTHSLFIGGNLEVGFSYDDGQEPVGWFSTAHEDDKLNCIFNSDDPATVNVQYNISFHDVTFNCAGVSGNMIINGNAVFNKGIVSGVINFKNGSSWSGASPVSYVDGWVSRVGNGPFTFPIGDDNIYAPLTMSAPPYPHVTYSAGYLRGNAEALGPIQDPGLYSISNCEYWNFESNSNAPIDITVGWNGASGCGSSPYISNVSGVTLAMKSTSGWSSHGGSGTGTTTNGSVTWKGVTQFGQLTFGNLKPGCPAPYEYSTTAVTPSSATVQWSIMSGSINFDVDYKVQGATNWIKAATATTSNILTIPNLPTGIYDWRVRSNCSSLSSAYVQGNFTIVPTNPPAPVCNDVYEINNTSRQAKLIRGPVNSAITTASDIDWFKVTSPVDNLTNLVVTLSNLYADYDLYVYDQGNKLLGSSTKFGTTTEVVTYNSTARKATYYIKVMGKNGAFNPSYCYSLEAQLNWSPSSSSINVAPQIEMMDDKVISQMGLMNEVDRQMLYPNPASEFVYLDFNSETKGSLNVQIVNSLGQLIKQQAVNTLKGHNQFKIPVADFRAGMYILRMNKGDLNLTRKFVIAR